MRLSLKLLFFHSFARDDKDIVRCPFHAKLPQHKISKGIMGQKEAEAFCGYKIFSNENERIRIAEINIDIFI